MRGAPTSAVPLGKVIQSALPTFARAGAVSPDFEATVYHHQPTVTYTSAVHVAHVEVDAGTGAVRLLRYVVAHDCGLLINPVIVEGQIHGGVAQGVGGGLLEEMMYDGEGQLLTGTFMDYLIPTAMELPADRDGAPRVPVAAQSARRQGDRRGRRHLAARGHRQCRGRCAGAVRGPRDTAPLGPSRVLDLIAAGTSRAGGTGASS